MTFIKYCRVGLHNEYANTPSNYTICLYYYILKYGLINIAWIMTVCMIVEINVMTSGRDGESVGLNILEKTRDLRFVRMSTDWQTRPRASHARRS